MGIITGTFILLGVLGSSMVQNTWAFAEDEARRLFDEEGRTIDTMEHADKAHYFAHRTHVDDMTIEASLSRCKV